MPSGTDGPLCLAPQYTSTRELLARAARSRGMDVVTLPARPTGDGTGPGGHYYGGPHYAARFGAGLGVALLEPADDWLPRLPFAFRRRNTVLTTLGAARRLDRPAFVKPPSDKSFRAAVHADGGGLPAAADLPDGTPVQIADVVEWAVEFRLFVLDGEVRTGSQYAVHGRLESAPLDGHRHRAAVLSFARRLLDACGDTLPSAVVVDVGLLRTERAPDAEWAVVEANMAWFSNCYAADPDRALDVVLRAAGPRERLSGRDRRFCRDDGRGGGSRDDGHGGAVQAGRAG
ncbi:MULTISPECIES: ATP-grasp domain-containing protein [Streptomyces]|uniref:ATP-grasp domain-containing protein n=1 Tax=Streptomyces TaxID=1883 RepID=UPI00163D3427|nr:MULTISPECIES: ATP-grasp domain-containing protein [Streptomyces]MBC2879237.1 ATP-grasp domain-containing protein [Streptomyces sp. TYQ1024]UBI39792.1 ATP-grasp domain-containing protein [Streptomyces mobaraensis]UKW32373.1 ATP-grasp domain-containing protein [Streptomyces sp. TYQ1024]